MSYKEMRLRRIMARDIAEYVQFSGLLTEAERTELRSRLENTFRLSTTVEHHTINSDCLENYRKVDDFIREEGFFWCSTVEGEISLPDVILEDVHQFWGSPNYMSMSSLVKNGFEIKLSLSDSYISKNGRICLNVRFTGTGWITDIRKFQGEGKMKISRRVSTKNIINKLKIDAVEASRKADGILSIKTEDAVSRKADGIVSIKTEDATSGKADGIESMKSEDADDDKIKEVNKCPSRPQSSRRVAYKKIWKRSRNKPGFRKGSGAWVLSLRQGHSVKSPKTLLYPEESLSDLCVGLVQLKKILLNDVWYDPDNKFNTLSLLDLAFQGFEFKFTKKEAIITKKGKTYLKAPMVGNFWIFNSAHEKNGWLDGSCPYETKDILSFKEKHGDEFTMEEIMEAFKEFTHDCELEGLRK